MPSLFWSRLLILLITLTPFVSACTSVPDLLIFPGVHKLSIQQGNIIEQKKLDQLELGMTRTQVNFVLGTPLVSDTFELDRWDYLYELHNPEGKLTRRSVSLYFEENLLVDIVENDTSS